MLSRGGGKVVSYDRKNHAVEKKTDARLSSEDGNQKGKTGHPTAKEERKETAFGVNPVTPCHEWQGFFHGSSSQIVCSSPP
jgi:hypothetical protein